MTDEEKKNLRELVHETVSTFGWDSERVDAVLKLAGHAYRKEFEEEMEAQLQKERDRVAAIAKDTEDHIPNRYLYVKFHDNDYGSDFVNGLERMWKHAFSSNAHNLSTDPDDEHFASCTFVELWQKLTPPYLYRLILNYTVGSYVANYPEIGTRGWYWAEGPSQDWDIDIVAKEIASTKDYMDSFDVEFVDTDEASKKWQNGEHFMLDLKTGKAKSF
jgi:hypothetical protein